MTEEPDPIERALLDIVLAKESRHAERAAAPYDGALGELPTWFPEIDRGEFLRLRNKVLDRVWADGKRARPEDLKAWIEAYRTAGENDGRCDYWPTEFDEEIGRLAQLYAAFLMGEDKGLRFLLGPKAADHLKRGRLAVERPKKIQKQGADANSDRADRFYTAVKDFAWRRKKDNPMLKATHIAKEIEQEIIFDKLGEKFPRMSNGDPYSSRSILDTTRQALKQLF